MEVGGRKKHVMKRLVGPISTCECAYALVGFNLGIDSEESGLALRCAIER